MPRPTPNYRIPSPKKEVDGYSSEPNTPTATRINDLPLRTPIPSIFPSPFRGRALSLPPLSSDGLDGLIYSSPIVGTKEQKRAIISRKSQKKWSATIAQKKATQSTEDERVAAEVKAKRLTFFNKTLSSIYQHGYTFGQLVRNIGRV
jgi:hypothetical protein